jgi:hypothetical protein
LQARCNHLLTEKGYPVRLYWGPTEKSYHLQTQGFKENEWCWATLVDGKVEWTRQDYWFNPKKVYTFKEYMALWFRVWDIEEKESPR